MKETSGPMFMGQGVDALKERLATVEGMKASLEQVDMTDFRQWVIQVTSGAGVFIAAHQALPNVAYALTHLLNGVSALAHEAGPEYENSVKAAILTAMEETSTHEVSENENSNSRVSN